MVAYERQYDGEALDGVGSVLDLVGSDETSLDLAMEAARVLVQFWYRDCPSSKSVVIDEVFGIARPPPPMIKKTGPQSAALWPALPR